MLLEEPLKLPMTSVKTKEKRWLQNGDGDSFGVDFYHSPFDTAIIALSSFPFRRSRLSLLCRYMKSQLARGVLTYWRSLSSK